jgi:hypothetical protein
MSLQSSKLQAQVVLNANGTGDTYELINSVLAPGNNVIEAPDCSHTAFGRHIAEIFDTELNTNVFQFHIHVTPDNDRCINFDRQRNEIKTYDKSPDNLKGIAGETVVYQWKFKIPVGFQSTSAFTHIHQLKSVGGLLEDMPMYTFTTRKGSPDKFELRYAETDAQITLKQTDLAPFIGNWVEVTETITYGTAGAYEVEIKKVSDGATLFSYANNNIINWRLDADFVRPKWGIYRSLNYLELLRDETLLFANFSIEELSSLSVKENEFKQGAITLYPNPTHSKIYFKENTTLQFNAIEIIDNLGRTVLSSVPSNTQFMDVSNLKTGLYFVTFKNNSSTVSIQKLWVQ